MEILKVSPLGIDGEMIAMVVAAVGVVLLVVACMRMAMKSYDRPNRRQ